MEDLGAGDAGGGQACAEIGGEGFGGEGDEAWAPAPALGEGDLEIAAGGEGDGLVAVGE